MRVMWNTLQLFSVLSTTNTIPFSPENCRWRFVRFTAPLGTIWAGCCFMGCFSYGKDMPAITRCQGRGSARSHNQTIHKGSGSGHTTCPGTVGCYLRMYCVVGVCDKEGKQALRRVGVLCNCLKMSSSVWPDFVLGVRT
jgi:hypothetical protein